jgi:membrane-bound serine protease (ClpP class)
MWPLHVSEMMPAIVSQDEVRGPETSFEINRDARCADMISVSEWSSLKRGGDVASLIASIVAGFLSLFAPTVASTADEPSSATSQIVALRIDGPITPIMAEYVDGGIDQANHTGASLILITIDTPGGLDTSMREIIQHVLESPAPVVVYVSPTGQRAASAGFFILLAADVAAMAPGTHTGAASPLLAIGGYPVSIDDTLRRKVENDATAYLRSFAIRRARNATLAETAVTEAKAFTEQEALDGRLIDLVAASQQDLLTALAQRTITRFDGRATKLTGLPRAAVTELTMSTRQRLMARIVHPDALFVLLIVGVLGLYVEFTHPGLIAPGVVGAISILLALFAMQILPVDVTGVLLLLLAFTLFILEAKFTSHGVLGVGGAIAMLLGAVMLVRSPLTGGGVSLGVAVGATLPFGVLTIALMRLVLRSRAWPPQAGIEQLVREVGEVRMPIGGADEANRGLVFVHGELWRAAATRPIAVGAHVRVSRVDGLTLWVERVD